LLHDDPVTVGGVYQGHFQTMAAAAAAARYQACLSKKITLPR
jgi:hypothetical protein